MQPGETTLRPKMAHENNLRLGPADVIRDQNEGRAIGIESDVTGQRPAVIGQDLVLTSDLCRMNSDGLTF
jgi:hypothetical protein